MKYLIVFASDIDHGAILTLLVKNVNLKLRELANDQNERWEPVGNPFKDDNNRWCQAIRFEEKIF